MSEQFVGLARGTQKSQGMTDMAFVEVPHPIGMIPREEVWAKMDAAYPKIMDAVFKWKPKPFDASEQRQPYPARRVKFKGTVDDINRIFAKRGWSLSLPVIPPTEELVANMLKGTSHKPDEVLWVVPPRNGILTVELAAALGVMAGATPEMMPLLLATVQAMKNEEAYWRGTSTTTASTYPLLLISGPIVKKMGLNCSTGTSGGGNPVTNSLGYFVNLVGDVVGGSVAPTLDKSTHGNSADLVATVFVENADANPWHTTFAKQHGFKDTDSVVAISTSYPPNSNVDHNSVTGTELLTTMSAGVAGTASGVTSCLADLHNPDTSWANNCVYVILVLSPEHAATIAREFPSFEDVQKFVVKNAVLPFRMYAKGTCVPKGEFLNPGPDTLIPRFSTPDAIKVIVSGGPGKQSQIWTPFPLIHYVSFGVVEE